MLIAIDHSNASHSCTVHLDDYQVPFGSDAQAEAFVRQLRKRIEAPHVLPHVSRPLTPSKFRRADAAPMPLDQSA